LKTSYKNDCHCLPIYFSEDELKTK
jgi:hypothetical protein